MRTFNLRTEISADRVLHIRLPADVPVGPAEIVMVIATPSRSDRQTLGELLDPEFFGMWRDRADLGDGVDFAQHLRHEGWKRSA